MKRALGPACNPCIDRPKVARSVKPRSPMRHLRRSGPAGGHHASTTGIVSPMRHVFLLLGSAMFLMTASEVRAGQVECRQSAGVDQRLATGLCDALRDRETPDGLRLRVLATTPFSITAMLVTSDTPTTLTLTWEDALRAFLKAYSLRPQRAEPLVRIAYYYLMHKQPHLAYLFSKRACEQPYPNDLLFVEKETKNK